MLFKPQPLIFPPKVSTSLLVPAEHHNYALAGQLVNAFAAGRIGAEDDLWLVGAEPPRTGEGAAQPLLSGNLLDAFGRRLVTLDRNEIVFQARPCTLQPAEGGWRLLAGGQEVLRVETRAVHAAGCAVTYLHCVLKDRTGAVRLETRGGPDSPTLIVRGRHAYGLRGDDTFAMNEGLSEEELARAVALLRQPARTAS